MTNYRSREVYTPIVIGPEGNLEYGISEDSTRIQGTIAVLNSAGMVTAILSPEDFEIGYEEIT